MQILGQISQIYPFWLILQKYTFYIFNPNLSISLPLLPFQIWDLDPSPVVARRSPSLSPTPARAPRRPPSSSVVDLGSQIYRATPSPATATGHGWIDGAEMEAATTNRSMACFKELLRPAMVESMADTNESKTNCMQIERINIWTFRSDLRIRYLLSIWTLWAPICSTRLENRRRIRISSSSCCSWNHIGGAIGPRHGCVLSVFQIWLNWWSERGREKPDLRSEPRSSERCRARRWGEAERGRARSRSERSEATRRRCGARDLSTILQRLKKAFLENYKNYPINMKITKITPFLEKTIYISLYGSDLVFSKPYSEREKSVFCTKTMSRVSKEKWGKRRKYTTEEARLTTKEENILPTAP